VTLARDLVVARHYLHSFPGGTQICLGAFAGDRLLGAMTFGVGPMNAHRLVDGARPRDCLTLSRLWLDDALPHLSESRVIGLAIRALRRHTDVKFLLSYADPSACHVGTIYQATNWTYTGLSEATPFYDLGDGVPIHSRTLSHSLGSHSKRYLKEIGIDIKTVPQAAKYRYVYFLDRRWRCRLTVPELPYPKKGDSN
jgi:hypothetical protein